MQKNKNVATQDGILVIKNVYSKNNIVHGDYVSYRTIKQLKIPFEFEYKISADDPVRFVDTFVEKMVISDLYKTYSRIRKNQETLLNCLKLFCMGIYSK